MDDFLVSIDCITYNQENYIADAIESFLMQKTNFKFEILIHDDASTDTTANIIRKYEKKYPNIIKPIYQTENQYSKGRKILPIIWSKAKGKYIAICEGDDYWADPYKLQKQVDYMENNPQCSMCFHAAKIIDSKDGNRLGVIRPYNKTFTLPYDNIFLGGGGYCPTASILFVKKYMNNPPDFYFDSPVGDHALALALLMKGKIAYIDEEMSVRRLWVPNSWNTKHFEKGIEKKKAEHYNNMVKMIDSFNILTQKKWDYEVNKIRVRWYIEKLRNEGETRLLKDTVLKNMIKKLDRKNKARVFLKLNTPKIYKFLVSFVLKIKKLTSKVEVEYLGRN